MVLSWICIYKNANPLWKWFNYLQKLLTLTYEGIPIGIELDFHLEECKSTFKLVQILTEVTYINLWRHTGYSMKQPQTKTTPPKQPHQNNPKPKQPQTKTVPNRNNPKPKQPQTITTPCQNNPILNNPMSKQPRPKQPHVKTTPSKTTPCQNNPILNNPMPK